MQANDAPSEPVGDDRSDGTGIGDKLRIAREKRALSLEQVADALHLDESIITALEQERFETLGAPVYIRGHLKTYTQLLGLPADEFISGFEEGTPNPVVAPALRRSGITPATINPVLLVAGGFALLLGLLLGIYVMLGNDDPDDLSVVKNSADTRVVEVTDAPDSVAPAAFGSAETVDTAPMPDVRPEATEAETVPVSSEQEAETQKFSPAPRPVATMRLGLQFNQESWVEIYDANRRLLFGLQREGNRHELTGEPPFNLLIGNASAVALTINDEPYDVPVSRTRGKVARFEITGEETE